MQFNIFISRCSHHWGQKYVKNYVNIRKVLTKVKVSSRRFARRPVWIPCSRWLTWSRCSCRSRSPAWRESERLKGEKSVESLGVGINSKGHKCLVAHPTGQVRGQGLNPPKSGLLFSTFEYLKVTRNASLSQLWELAFPCWNKLILVIHWEEKLMAS